MRAQQNDPGEHESLTKPVFAFRPPRHCKVIAEDIALCGVVWQQATQCTVQYVAHHISLT